MSVATFARRVKDALQSGIPGSFVVRGELGRVSVTGGHLYSTLRDAEAAIDLVVWASSLARLTFEPREGMAVVVRGSIGFFEKRGRTQVVATSMVPQGQGDLEGRKKELADLFRSKGWFDDSRKRTWPRVPRRVAIVTSAEAAAYEDVLRVWRTAGRTCQLSLASTVVQGPSAATMIARAIARVNEQRSTPPIDCILLVRGGGSLEDLWSFNEPEVVEAIVGSRLPVITGIGHEIDRSLADAAADRSAATPTQAATWVFADREAVLEEVASRGDHLRRAIIDAIGGRRNRVELLARSEVLQSPRAALGPAAALLSELDARVQACAKDAIARDRRRIDAIALRVERRSPSSALASARSRADQLMRRAHLAAVRALERLGHRVDAQAGCLDSLSPTRVLDRGYSITLSAEGRPIRSTADVATGAHVRTIVGDGTIASTVTTTNQEPA